MLIVALCFTVKNRCPRDGHMCSHLCLLIPGGYKCACPNGSHFLPDNRFRCDAGKSDVRTRPIYILIS